MAVSQYTVRFNGDGTLATIPAAFVLIPGVDVTLLCRVDEVISGTTQPLDLTGARVFFELIGQGVATGMYKSGEPTIVLTEPKAGLFAIVLTADMTDYLLPGGYTWEVKAILPSGIVRRLGYANIGVGQSLIPTLIA